MNAPRGHSHPAIRRALAAMDAGGEGERALLTVIEGRLAILLPARTVKEQGDQIAKVLHAFESAGIETTGLGGN